MKLTIILVVCVLCVAEGFLLPPNNPVICSNPALFTSVFCGLIPQGLLKPICATNEVDNAVLFLSRCHMFVFNLRCKQRYRPNPTQGLCVPLPQLPPLISNVVPVVPDLDKLVTLPLPI